MAKQYLVEFINAARGQGKNDAEIRIALSTQPGVTEADIVDAFAAVENPALGVAPTAPAGSQPVTPPPSMAAPSAQPGGPTPVTIPPTHASVMESAGMTMPKAKSPVKRIIFACIIVLLLLAGAGLAAAHYTGLYPISWLPVSSEKVWEKVQGQTVSEPVTSDFSFGYTDAGLDGVESPFGGMLKNIKVEVKGTAYANGAISLPGIESQSSINYSLASGNTSFSTGLEYRIVGEALYLNIGQNPFLSAMMMGFSEGQSSQKFDWLKIGLDKKTLDSLQGEMGGASEIGQLADQRYWQDFANKWKDEEFLEKPTYVGKETLRDVKVLHYKTNVKKDAVRSLFSDFLGKLLANEDQDTKESAALFANGLIDKVQIEAVDIWVGEQDARVHKITVKSNAPSVASFAKALQDESEAYMQSYNAACSGWSQGCNPPAQPSAKEQVQKLLAALEFSAQFNLSVEFYDYGKTQNVVVPQNAYDMVNSGLESARSKSRDAKRLADVRQLASAVELYFNDFGRYPARLEDLTVTYIGILPTAPEPVDGSCTPEQSRYIYTPEPDGKDYRLTFCLGAQTGGYSAGVRTLTAAGIQ